MDTAPSSLQWYALQLRTRWENTTATFLNNKGYETFLPTCESLNQVRGNSKKVTAPLFPGYVFCRFDALRRLPILVTPGVIKVVGRGRIPVPVEDDVLEAIQKMVSTGLRVEPCPYLVVGQRVRIEHGALTGVEGILTRIKGAHRIVVSISLLHRSVAVEIDRAVVCAARPADVARELASVRELQIAGLGA
jgi:transcription antitermination factor NusG